MSAALPNPPSEYAAEGTVAHTLAEQLATGSVDHLALASRVGEVVEQEGFQITITEEMVEACVEYEAVIAEDFKNFHVAAGKGNSVEVHQAAEIKVQAKSIDEELWGTADYLLFQKGKKLIVYDFKYGKGYAVSAEKNKQMGIYAIAAMDTIAGEAYDEVELVIVQPRTYDPVRRWVAPKEWLNELRAQLKVAVADTRDPLAKVAAGDWCRWCAAKATCPELYKKAQETAAVDFAVVLPPAEKGATVGLPHVSELPVEKLVLALGWEDTFDAWFKAIRQRATDLLSSGQEVPGYKLVEGRSNRRYKDEAQIVAIFEPVVGERLWEKKILSPAKLEAVVGKGKLAEYTEKPEGRKTLARETDARQAVRSSAAADFGPPEERVAKALEIAPPRVKCEGCENEDVLGPCLAHTKKLWPQ